MIRVAVACTALLAGIGATPVLGQETYTLSEDDQWQLAESVDPGTPAGQLALARKALAAGDAKGAERLAGAWIEQHERNPLLAEAYLLRGDALRAQKNYYKALFDYEFVARGYPASETFVTVIERELEIGTLYATGTKRKMLGMRIIDAGDVAEELLIRIQERMPGSQLAEKAALELANYYFRRRKMRLAVEMYSIFLENFPDSDHVSHARKRLIYAHLATFKGPEFDASGLHEARAKLRELIVLEPAAADDFEAESLLTRLDESDARKMLLTAQWYLRIGDPVAAELMVRRLLELYPRTNAAAEALRLVEKIIPRLPPVVLAESPDYETLRKALLGREPPEPDDDGGDGATQPAEGERQP
ncbi:MAG: outer membrane protein assembly factor BamD [Planctomycetota bacterium]|jgi:outer membrane protein assembly factor BamD